MTSIEKFEQLDERYERLMKEYSKKLRSHSLRLTRNQTDAEDLYQDTALKIYMNMEKMTDEQKFGNWALRVMQRLHLDKIRYNKRRPQTTSFDELNAFMGCEVDFEDKKVDVESEVMLGMVNEMNSRQVRAMMNSLSPAYSSSLALNTYGTTSSLDLVNSLDDGLNYGEVASAQNIEYGTVKSRLHRARAAMKSVMLENSFSPEEYLSSK
jgi:RNA polymerase sigma-70 factor (ECF subfamily)